MANYFLLALSSLVVLLGFLMLVQPNAKSSTPAEVFLFLILFLLVCLSCILNIIIINRYFPETPLPEKPGKLLKISRIIMIVISSIFGLSSIGFFSLLSDSATKDELSTLLAIIFFIIFFLLCLNITLLQFQISRYLNRQSAGSINQLIDSIGK